MAEAPSELTIGQIVTATIGPMCIVDCLEDPAGCPRSEYCECRVVYSLINDRIVEVLEEYTLADLLDKDWLLGHGALRALPKNELEVIAAAGCSWDRREDESQVKGVP